MNGAISSAEPDHRGDADEDDERKILRKEIVHHHLVMRTHTAASGLLPSRLQPPRQEKSHHGPQVFRQPHTAGPECMPCGGLSAAHNGRQVDVGTRSRTCGLRASSRSPVGHDRLGSMHDGQAQNIFFNSSAAGAARYHRSSICRLIMPRPKAAPALPPLLSAAYRLHTDGHLDHAEAGYRAVLASEPQRIEAMELLARLRRQRGDLAEALNLYAAMMKADHRSAAVASNHGVVLVELGRPGEALTSLDRALILKPNMVAALYNRGNALMALDRFAEALTSFERAIAVEPTHVDAHYNRGNALRELRRHDEALASYRKAAALAPQRADIRVNEALTLLLTGKLREGFSVYEWRRRAVPDPQAPLWLGAVPLAGRTILIHAEQGFGDTLQFIRYAPLLAARGARVVAAVPPVLKPLIATMPGVYGADGGG